MKYPNPLLRADNADIVTVDDSVKQIAREMLLVMYAAEGIGLGTSVLSLSLLSLSLLSLSLLLLLLLSSLLILLLLQPPLK